MFLVNLSNLPWIPGRLKRNQAIFLHLLAASERLEGGIYVEPAEVDGGARLPGLRVTGQIEFSGKPVTVVRPVHRYPLRYRGGIRHAGSAYVAALLRRRLRGRPYVLWLNSPGLLEVALAERCARGAALRVFDSSDDFATFAPEYAPRVSRLLALADRVVCVNEHVCATLPHGSKTVFRNCTDFENFQRRDARFALPPFLPKPPGAVYIGFTGGLNSNRADLDLIRHLLLRFPAYRFLFIGYSNDPLLVESVLSFPNAAFIPEVPYTELPFLIRAFDVAIVPHVDNEHTRGNDLLKVLDYFACGVPVVSTPVSDVERYGAALYVARDAETFAERLEQLAGGALRHDPGPGQAIAAERSWGLQVRHLARWLEL